ncbi:methyltransferase [Streptomyces sp. NBRC 109706]|uniref:methyltransferase n=1 Tax=Streptomyces sp. NBRC 109706 TaxID=1550035 RepID=UPI00078319BD|nr:methyltransferase [Streptomyces sp. NBRC 109706]
MTEQQDARAVRPGAGAPRSHHDNHLEDPTVIIPDDILTTLRTRARTTGPRLTLAGPRLDPRLYERIDTVLQGAGGRWDRTAQAHVFPDDAADALARLLTTRHVTTPRETIQAQQYFPTPEPVVARLLELAAITPGMRVLEPSAGRGALALAAASAGALVDAVEVEPGHAEVLRAAHHPGVTALVADFLATRPDPVYHRVIMNPPFTRGADIAHVTHALGALRAEGLLVAVMSHATATAASAARFRQLVADRGGQVQPLPAGAFRASGTDVRALIVTIPATRPAGAPPTVWPTDSCTTTTPAPAPPPLSAPAVIARRIVADLQRAATEFGRVADDLDRTTTP